MIAVFAFSFIGLLCLSAPITVALGGSALAYALISGNLPITTIIQTTFGGLATFPLLAIPLFMLAGNLMNEGGITADLVRFARLMLGHIRGGVGLATILACAIFSAITGAAVATAVAIGVVMIPAMKKMGYEEEVGAALTCTASCMGPIIPPSIPFIIYGVTANVSIGALFLLPGRSLSGSAPGCCPDDLHVLGGSPARLSARPQDPGEGGHRCGLEGAAGPDDAGHHHGRDPERDVHPDRGGRGGGGLRMKSIPKVLLNAGLESGMVMLLIALSEPFAWIVSADQIPQLLIDWISGITTSPVIILLLINIFLLLLGIPIETAPALVIVTPVLAPIAASMGIDPVHIGIVICLNLVLGLITPPVGAVLFAVCAVGNITIDKLSRAIWPPFLVSLVVLAIVTYVPWLSTFLPKLFMGY